MASTFPRATGSCRDELPAPSREAFERGLWLAKLNSTRMTVFDAVEVSAAAERLISQSTAEFTVIDRICEVLQQLVDRAAAEGVEADLAVRFGRGWIEIIRRVLRDGHDPVIVGTRNHAAVHDLLLGTTGSSKLLRKCPCPVWVTRPRTGETSRSVLVAHCLRPVGDKAMELGCSMAEMEHCELHVQHALEHAELEQHVELEIDDRRIEELRAAARTQIEAQLAGHKFVRPPKMRNHHRGGSLGTVALHRAARN